MIIVEKNEGAKIPYEVSGTKVCFDDDLTINLSKRQDDWAVHIDVCSDKDGALVIGAASGSYYVAQIDIPAREYEETVTGDGEDAVTERQPLPIDMDKVTLTLWALENRQEVTE
jgi:hypothetical protein